MIYHREHTPFGIIYWKGYTDILIDVKQRDGTANFISLKLLPFEYKYVFSVEHMNN